MRDGWDGERFSRSELELCSVLALAPHHVPAYQKCTPPSSVQDQKPSRGFNGFAPRYAALPPTLLPPCIAMSRPASPSRSDGCSAHKRLTPRNSYQARAER